MNTHQTEFGVRRQTHVEIAEAHCDGSCGIYDPAAARIAAEAAVSMTKKILELTPPDTGDTKAMANYLNTLTRYVAIKEEQAQIAKDELLILWTDYFNNCTTESAVFVY